MSHEAIARNPQVVRFDPDAARAPRTTIRSKPSRPSAATPATLSFTARAASARRFRREGELAARLRALELRYEQLGEECIAVETEMSAVRKELAAIRRRGKGGGGGEKKRKTK